MNYKSLRKECNDFLFLHKRIDKSDDSSSIESLVNAAKSLPAPFDPSRPEVHNRFQADQSKLSKQLEAIYTSIERFLPEYINTQAECDLWGAHLTAIEEYLKAQSEHQSLLLLMSPDRVSLDSAAKKRLEAQWSRANLYSRITQFISKDKFSNDFRAIFTQVLDDCRAQFEKPSRKSNAPVPIELLAEETGLEQLEPGSFIGISPNEDPYMPLPGPRVG